LFRRERRFFIVNRFLNEYLLVALVCAAIEILVCSGGHAMKVGVGKSVITPQKNMWMAGYASRSQPSEGKEHDLFAKTLVFEEEDGTRSVLLTADLLGFPRDLSLETASRVEEKWGIPRERLMLCSSHTHTGPVIRGNLDSMYFYGEDQAQLVRAYTDSLPEKFLESIEAALADLSPCHLKWGIGQAHFGKNRRKYTIGGVVNDLNPIGPVDPDVPVLEVEREDGSTKAVAFGYACHNTTLSFYKFTGDYAGFAQAYLEEKLPGTIALYAAGCGGDINPLPRGTVDHALKYGTQLGEAVLAVLNGEMKRVEGPIEAAYEEIDLPLSEPPTREELEEQTRSNDKFIASRARMLLETIEREGDLDTTYPYPIQIWKFGKDLQMTVLGGEVVVDYSLLLKHLYGKDSQWVIAYANDVMAYIPSLRVLYEGGYEGESSMIYYGLYGPWAPSVEEKILEGVRQLME
jgi:hypothetical protein